MFGNQTSGPICPSCKSDGPHFISEFSDAPLAIRVRCKCETGWWEILHEDD